MVGNTHRLTEGCYGSTEALIEAAQRNAVQLAESGLNSGYSLLGIWLDDSRKGVSMRLIRDTELGLEQSWAWRPHKAFPVSDVAAYAPVWLDIAIRGND